MPNTDDLMLCVVGMDGAARCHHRDGIVSASVAPSAVSASCPGADAVLRSPCRAGDGPRLALVDRGARENDFCKLGNSRVKLSREREETR